jgi:hypothetical protein
MRITLVLLRGFEPLTLSGQRSERCAYASSATGACYFNTRFVFMYQLSMPAKR